ncbi:MAG: flagellar hook-associated protein FlgL [Oscillospiraceae bacterium]|nr:flagellar hook-associated protein FlgL [Oscillospiraceae bacterium]
MRITNGMMMKRYSRNLNVNLAAEDKTSQQIASGRRFQRGSEDPVRALRALQVRRGGDALEQFSSNIDVADAWLSQTETVITAIKSSATDAMNLIIQGRNDTLAPEDRQVIATSLRSIQDALLKDLNTQIAGKYILGGANTKEVPFTVDPHTGHLMFNGEDVFLADENHPLQSLNDKVYTDLTGEFKLDGDGNIVDKSTVFDMYTPGVNVIGIGPDNLYNLIGRIADSFESEYMPTNVDVPDGLGGTTIVPVNAGEDRMQDIDGPVVASNDPNSKFYNDPYAGPIGLFQRLQTAQTNTLVELVKVGEKSNFVSYLKERNDNNLYQTQTMQNNLEFMPPDEAILNFKMQDYVYKACLQMSSYIMQPSLMDYLKS